MNERQSNVLQINNDNVSMNHSHCHPLITERIFYSNLDVNRLVRIIDSFFLATSQES